MDDLLFLTLNFIIPGIIITHLYVISFLLFSYVTIKLIINILAPTKKYLVNFYFNYLWVGCLLALVGFLIIELEYQMHFWEAPGIWGAPGKNSTLWGFLQYIYPPLGFMLGLALNTIIERHIPKSAMSVRYLITIFSSFFLILTIIVSAINAFETIG